jgi:hypothetical protein
MKWIENAEKCTRKGKILQKYVHFVVEKQRKTCMMGGA